MPTTWYIEPLNGTDGNAGVGAGDSFATRRKKIQNIVAAASAPGDTVRIMASVPTSLSVNGAWTEGPVGTAVSITSSTNATPIVVTLSQANYSTLAPAVGDTVVIKSHTTNTKANGVWDISAIDNGAYKVTLVNADGSNSVGNGSGGASGTIQNINACRVKLASALTKSIAITGNQGAKSNWSQSTNITCTVITSDYREGGECQQIAVTGSFTTGLAAYSAMAATDFSSYQQISFWVKQTSGTIGSAGDLVLKLCSDAAGVTAVDTLNVPAITMLNAWHCFTVNKGSALGASIQSIALYVTVDRSAQTFLLDNIQACKVASNADALSLQSLVGKNISSDTFYPLTSINSTRLMLDTGNTPLPSAPPAPYWGETAAAAAMYKLEPYRHGTAAASTTAIQTAQEAGSAGNLISYSGGWDTTNMSTQTGETWFDGLNFNGYGLTFNSLSYLGLEKCNFARYYIGFTAGATASSGVVWSVPSVVCNSGNGVYDLASSGNTGTLNFSINNVIGAALGSEGTYSLGVLAGCTQYGINFNNNNNSKINFNVASGFKQGMWGPASSHGLNILAGSNNHKISCPYIKYFANGIVFGGGFNNTGNYLYDCVISNNTTASVNFIASAQGSKNYLVRCTLSDGTPYAGATASFTQAGGIYSHGQDGDVNKHYQYLNNGIIQSQTSNRHTASGIAWRISPTNTTYPVSANPLALPIARRRVAAGSQVTATLWMYRDNSGLTARLMCNGNQTGVATDQYTNMTQTSQWEQVTLQFTPTVAGVIEFTAECFGGTSYNLDVDDFAISQA